MQCDKSLIIITFLLTSNHSHFLTIQKKNEKNLKKKIIKKSCDHGSHSNSRQKLDKYKLE